MERIIELKQRGLTPRNISANKKSTIIQVAAQHQSNSEKEKHRHIASLTNISEYETQVNCKLTESPNETSGNRIVSIAELKNGVDATLCRECTTEKIRTIEDDTILSFEKYFMQNEDSMSSKEIFATYKKNRDRNKKRKLDLFLSNAKMLVKEQTIAQSSTLEVHCASDKHRTPMHRLLERRVKHKNSRIGMHNTNLLIMMAPFFAGIGPSEMTDVANVLDLPNAKNMDRTIRRYQPEIAHAIIKVSEAEMRISLAEEIKCTIISEKGEEYYNKWIDLPVQDRERIGLVIAYDMGW